MIFQKQITNLLDLFIRNRCLVFNVNNSNHKKNVLISYLTFPFINDKNLPYHSNLIESCVIAEVFDSLGYNVDVIRYNCNYKRISKLLCKKKYEIIFGVEPNFIDAVSQLKPRLSIYYATGAHYKFQNKAEEERLQNLKKRKGVLLPPVRRVTPHDSSAIADAVICFGNDWTKSTYVKENKKIFMLRVTADTKWTLDKIGTKNYERSRKNFLWFGSNGAVHKGLDLVLEVFKNHPEIELHVCGNVKGEKGFMKIYCNELLDLENIHFHGWIEPHSLQYKELVERCAFTVLPSCSEGMSGTVAMGMKSGLIPLISKECGIDVKYGEIFETNNIKDIESTIVSWSNKKTEDISQYAYYNYKYANDNFTIEAFKDDFYRAIKDITHE